MKKFSNGFWSILVSAMIYGSFGTMVRLTSGAFGSVTQGLLRGSVVLIIAMFLIWKNKSSLKLNRTNAILVLLLGIAYFISLQTFTFSNQLTKISIAVFMLYVGSFTTSFIIGLLFFKEKLTATKVIALLVVTLGLLFTVNFNFMELSLGAGLGIICGIFDSIANSIMKVVSGENKDTVVFYKFIVSIVAGVVLLQIMGETPFKTITPLAVAIIILFGVCLVAVNNLLMIGFNKFDFTLGQIVLCSEIFFATMFGILFFAEMPAWYEFVGGVLIFSGATLVNFDLSKLFKPAGKK